ncbi:hypothetical protein Tco_1192930 [Tanacetum coccineum]
MMKTAKVLLNMSQAKAVSREKEKGPLPKIDPKDKGKKKIEEEDESESESDGIPEAEKKFKQLESNEEMARKIQEEWEGEEERNRLAEEKVQSKLSIEILDVSKAVELRLQDVLGMKHSLHNKDQRPTGIRPPTKNQLRNQMMTYLKHVGNFKHSELKTKKFEEIQALYEKIKRSDEDFISIGSTEDERLIKRMYEKGIDSSKSELQMRKKKWIMKYLTENILSKNGEQADKAEHLEEINQNVVIRSNGQKRYFSTLMRVLSIFDREDLNAVYQLVMDRYQDEIPEGVHTLVTEAGLVIHMLVEKKYPLRKKVLVQMLKLKLESEEDSTMALELIRFIKKLLAELEPEG